MLIVFASDNGLRMDHLWNRPDSFRLFALAENLAFDARGNARSGDVYFLDRVSGGSVWVPWILGECVHWHPFRLALLSTPRAGLHVVSEWRAGTDDPLRYGSNVQLARDGVLVLSPCNVVRPAERLEDALVCRTEAAHIVAVLRHRFFDNRATVGNVADLARLPRSRPMNGPGWERAMHPLAPQAGA